MSIITSSLALDANGLLIAVNNRYTPEYYRTIARPYLDANGLLKAKGRLEPDDPKIYRHAPYVGSVASGAPLVGFKPGDRATVLCYQDVYETYYARWDATLLECPPPAPWPNDIECAANQWWFDNVANRAIALQFYGADIPSGGLCEWRDYIGDEQEPIWSPSFLGSFYDYYDVWVYGPRVTLAVGIDYVFDYCILSARGRVDVLPIGSPEPPPIGYAYISVDPLCHHAAYYELAGTGAIRDRILVDSDLQLARFWYGLVDLLRVQIDRISVT